MKKDTSCSSWFHLVILWWPSMQIHSNSFRQNLGSAAPIRHWVLGNIDGISVQLGVDLSSTSITVWPFAGPSPSYGSHRYAFFLFQQFEG